MKSVCAPSAHGNPCILALTVGSCIPRCQFFIFKLLPPNLMKSKSPAAISPLDQTADLPIVRFGLFTVVNFAVVVGMWQLPKYTETPLYSEGSVLQWFQFGMLVASAIIFGLLAKRGAAFREMHILLAALAALAAVREQDSPLAALIPLLGWKLPFFLILIPALVFSFLRRDAIMAQARVFAAHRAFGLLWCAVMVAIPFAQMVGHGPFLQQVFGDDYQRPYKRVIEETAETIGWLWILLGAIDWSLNLRNRVSTQRAV